MNYAWAMRSPLPIMILQLLPVVALIIISEPKSQRMDFQKKPK